MSQPNRYAHRTLPEIDYAAHPAYGRGRGPWTTVLALLRFGGGLGIAGVRWIVDFEHLPKPPTGAPRLQWLCCNAYRMAAGTVRNTMRRLVPEYRVAATPEGRRISETLARDGVIALDLTADEQSYMAAMTTPWFEVLEARLTAGTSHFDENRIWIEETLDPEPYRWFRSLLERKGVIGGSTEYLKRAVTVAHLIPQINTTGTDFWTGQFTDIGLPDPACNYCHIDTAWGITKMIIYLDPVDETQGPFCYVRGSHRARDGFWGRMTRKANDYAGLSGTGPASRALFAALPRALQRKAAFGPDVEDHHPSAHELLKAEWQITSDQGQAILFDPDGVHRGGMVRKGRRRVIGVLLAEA